MNENITYSLHECMSFLSTLPYQYKDMPIMEWNQMLDLAYQMADGKTLVIKEYQEGYNVFTM